MPARLPSSRRRVCFVTGTRAELGLMQPVLRAIEAEPRLSLQLVVTGMHLDPAHAAGPPAAGHKVSAIVPWPAGSGKSPAGNAVNTGTAIAGMAKVFSRLRSDIVLVVGDRVEAFAAATAAHLSHRIVAHVHGGDRAAGQVDDALRHAITKLAHVHFPATRQSARRIARLGEDAGRIFMTGSPGNDGIVESAASPAELRAQMGVKLVPRKYALLLLHPVEADASLEQQRAEMVLSAIEACGVPAIITIHPNNDPGCRGILRAWASVSREGRLIAFKDLPRPIFLGLLRDAAVMVGNSSAGIIEAAAFGTPVLDIGPRQAGREHAANVTHVDYDHSVIVRQLRDIWNAGRPRRHRVGSAYAGGGAGGKIATALAEIPLDETLRRKLIAY